MDEISQVVEMECKGIYYLLRGSKETISLLIKGVFALADWKHEKGLKKAGECSWAKIQEVSEGNPVLLNFPKEMFEESIPNPGIEELFGGSGMVSPFDLYCQKNGLRFCTMPDMNPDDDYIPIAVPSQDAGIHSEQIKHYMKRKVEQQEGKNSEYEEQIAKAKDEIANARTEEEKTKAEAKLALLEEGKSQNEELLSQSKEQMEKDNVLEFSEYLKMGKGTNFEKDPKKALEQEQICGMVREFMPDDCMYPIREEALVPESKEIFYSQQAGEDELRTVRRSFKVGEDGIVYSTYKVVDPKEPGNVHIFSDKGVTAENWKKQLPELLEEAGMLSNMPTTAIRTEERLRAYVDGLDANFSKASEKGQKEEEKKEEPFSSEETKEFVEETKKEMLQKKAYEDSLYTTVAVPTESLMTDSKMELCLKLAYGNIRDIEISSWGMDETKIKINTEGYYHMDRTNGGESKLNGAEVLDLIEKNKTHNSTDELRVARTKTQSSGRK